MISMITCEIHSETTEVLSAEPITKKLKIVKWIVETPPINLELDSKILAKFCMWHMKY